MTHLQEISILQFPLLLQAILLNISVFLVKRFKSTRCRLEDKQEREPGLHTGWSVSDSKGQDKSVNLYVNFYFRVVESFDMYSTHEEA